MWQQCESLRCSTLRILQTFFFFFFLVSSAFCLSAAAWSADTPADNGSAGLTAVELGRAFTQQPVCFSSIWYHLLYDNTRKTHTIANHSSAGRRGRWLQCAMVRWLVSDPHTMMSLHDVCVQYVCVCFPKEERAGGWLWEPFTSALSELGEWGFCLQDTPLCCGVYEFLCRGLILRCFEKKKIGGEKIDWQGCKSSRNESQQHISLHQPALTWPT